LKLDCKIERQNNFGLLGLSDAVLTQSSGIIVMIWVRWVLQVPTERKELSERGLA